MQFETSMNQLLMQRQSHLVITLHSLSSLHSRDQTHGWDISKRYQICMGFMGNHTAKTSLDLYLEGYYLIYKGTIFCGDPLADRSNGPRNVCVICGSHQWV